MSISWEATSIPDCWEPNEEAPDAPTIALDEPISGYINGDLRGGEEQVYPNSFQEPAAAMEVMAARLVAAAVGAGADARFAARPTSGSAWFLMLGMLVLRRRYR